MRFVEINQGLSYIGWVNFVKSNLGLSISRIAFARLICAVIAALSFSACVQSQTPLITDAQPLLGQQFEVHLYEDFVDNKASSVHTAVYQWKDGNMCVPAASRRI